MITLIVWIVVLGLVYWLLTLLPLPDPFALILRVVFIILAILVLLSAVGLLPSLHSPILVR